MAKLILNIPDFRDMSKPVTVIDDVEDFKTYKDGKKWFKFEGKLFETNCEYMIKVDD